MGARLASTDENARPGKVIVAILTDGLENSSSKYTWKRIAKRIRHQTDTYNWDFLFLGATKDAVATAAKINIAAKDAATWAADAFGMRASAAGVTRRTTALRARAAGVTPADSPDADTPLGQIVAEEDNKGRAMLSK